MARLFFKPRQNDNTASNLDLSTQALGREAQTIDILGPESLGNGNENIISHGLCIGAAKLSLLTVALAELDLNTIKVTSSSWVTRELPLLNELEGRQQEKLI